MPAASAPAMVAPAFSNALWIKESFHAVLAMYQMLLRGVQPKRELYYTDLRLITQEML